MEEKQAPTRPYLESLTTSQLIKISDNEGIDIPSGLDRIFIIEELLDFYFPDEEELSTETDMMETELAETVPLPKQYNITFLEVMIRDPLWAFVFWEVKSLDKEQFEKAKGFNGYYLKVSPLVKRNKTSQQGADGVFTVPVGLEDTAWYLNFSPQDLDVYRQDVNCYKVELCVNIGGEETVLAASNPVKLPGLPEFPSEIEKKELCGALSNPLIRMSGYGDFPVLRKNERAFRLKRSTP